MDIDYTSEIAGRRKTKQNTITEDKRLEMKHEQLNREQRLASKSLNRERLDFHRRTSLNFSNYSLRSHQQKLSDSAPAFDLKERENAGSSLSSFSETDKMLRTYSLKEHWLKKKCSESTCRAPSILEEHRRFRSRQKSLSSLCTSVSQLSLIEDEQECPEWHRNLMEKIKMQKFQQELQDESAEITARVTGCVPVNKVRSQSAVSESKRSIILNKPSYMQTTIASRARLV